METKRKISGALPEAFADPSKWLHSYGDFITKNSSAVAQIESGLRSLTYVIPGKYRLRTESQWMAANHRQVASANLSWPPNPVRRKPFFSTEDTS